MNLNQMDEEIKKQVSEKCFNAFLIGALVSALVLGGSIYFFSTHKGEFRKMLFTSVGVRDGDIQ